MTINLTDAQKAIVNMDEGPILVKAGPGSGKTRVLIERVKRLNAYRLNSAHYQM